MAYRRGLLTPNSLYALCVPIYNLRISDEIGGELQVGDVTFVSAKKIPRVRRRLGIPERIADLRHKRPQLSEPDFFSLAQTYAHLKTRRGELVLRHPQCGPLRRAKPLGPHTMGSSALRYDWH